MNQYSADMTNHRRARLRGLDFTEASGNPSRWPWKYANGRLRRPKHRLRPVAVCDSAQQDSHHVLNLLFACSARPSHSAFYLKRAVLAGFEVFWASARSALPRAWPSTKADCGLDAEILFQSHQPEAYEPDDFLDTLVDRHEARGQPRAEPNTLAMNMLGV